MHCKVCHPSATWNAALPSGLPHEVLYPDSQRAGIISRQPGSSDSPEEARDYSQYDIWSPGQPLRQDMDAKARLIQATSHG